jgi:hypothetical protein
METNTISKKRLWVGRVLSGLPVAFLLFDGISKVLEVPAVREAHVRLGYPASLARGLGILELVCIVAYVIPFTSVFGAVLLTGFLGGAIATHVRVGDPLFSHVLFPTYVALLIWGGLFLRERRLRPLLPLRTQT